jgi:hypothetical protein
MNLSDAGCVREGNSAGRLAGAAGIVLRLGQCQSGHPSPGKSDLPRKGEVAMRELCPKRIRWFYSFGSTRWQAVSAFSTHIASLSSKKSRADSAPTTPTSTEGAS